MINTHIRTPPEPIGPALVFLHYYGGSTHSWDLVLDQLAADFHCIAIDLPGFGESPPRSDHQSVDDVADAVSETIVAQLGSKPFVIVGHSMGGKIALAIAAGTSSTGAAGTLAGVILLAPSPPVPEPITDKDRQEMLAQPSLPPTGQRKAAEKTVEKITHLPISESSREQAIVDNLRSSPEGWRAWLTTGSLNDISARMARINIPVTILAGDHDKALDHSVQTTLVLPYLPQATLHIISGAGHLLPIEAPNEITEAIEQFCVLVR